MISRMYPTTLLRSAAAAAGDAPSPVRAFLASDFVALVITVLQVGQVIPQHVEIAVEKSTAGLSPWLLVFNSLYTFLAFADVVLTDGHAVLFCDDGAYECFIFAQPLLQMFFSALLGSALWYWYLKYDHITDTTPDEERIRKSPIAGLFYNALPTATYFHLNCFLVFAVSCFAYWISQNGTRAQIKDFAHTCGDVSAVLNAVMWIPEIIVLAVYKHKGSLSKWWLWASVIMDIVYSVYLAALGFDVSVWLNNVPDAVLASTLLVMVYRFSENNDNTQANSPQTLAPVPSPSLRQALLRIGDRVHRVHGAPEERKPLVGTRNV